MLSLVLSVFILVDPPALKQCVVGCRADGRNGPGVTTCFYELLPVCRKRQVVCVESKTLACDPVAVEIGRDEYWVNDGSITYIYAPSY